jgi:uncharacterized protein with beta-barrel porin domain
MHNRTVGSTASFKEISTDCLLAQAADEFSAKTIQTGKFRTTQTGKPISIYIAPLGSVGTTNRIASQAGSDFTSVGALIGGDYAFSRAGVGVQAGYEQLHSSLHEHQGHFNIQTAFANAYATILPLRNGNFFIDLTAGAGKNWYDLNRRFSVHKAVGKPSGWQCDGYAGIGYDFLFKRYRLTPLASLQYIHLFIDGYKDHGEGRFDAKVRHQSINSLRSWLGFSYGGKFYPKSIVLMPEIRAFWLHEFSDHSRTSQAIIGNIENLSVQFAGGKRNYGVIGVELRALFASNWFISADYDYYWSNNIHTNLFHGEIGTNF